MDHQIERWMDELTLEEKASLCSGLDLWKTKAVARLGIPSLTITDGPHGVRLAETGIMSQIRIMAMGVADAIETSTKKATCFPTASAMAATWNMDLINHLGQAMGREAKVLGVDLLLAPGINIVRTPLGGRNFEFFSEDPVLSSACGIAMTRGIQSQGVGAVVKHLVCNNSEYRRMTVDIVVDERTLHEMYLKAFKRLIDHEPPAAIMSAYNKINGTYCSQSEELLTKILRNKWGYEGMVISDWAAVYDRLKALQAGLDLEMPGFEMHDEAIVEAVETGRIDEAILDRSVRRLLKCILMRNMKVGGSGQALEHHGLATHAASESFVLLKNEGVLPIDKTTLKRLVLVGRGWKNPLIQGQGSSKVRPKEVDDPVEALHRGLGDAVELVLVDEINEDTSREIEKSDMALVLVSNTGQMDGKSNLDGEGGDKVSISLPMEQEYLISKVSHLQENVIVGIQAGGPVDVSDWVDEVKGLFMLWLSGEGMGQALADVLTGVVNPSGKLPVSWPLSEGHTPSALHFPGENDKLYYSDRFFVGYRYALTTGIKSLYPFGYGLSYTSFCIDGARLSGQTISPGEVIKASVGVSNTGDKPGKTVVQVYSRRTDAKVKYPYRQLVAFEKIALQPGESKSVQVSIEAEDLSYYNVTTSEFELEPGQIFLEFGDSSENIQVSIAIEAKNRKEHRPYLSKYSYLSEWLEDDQGKEVLLEVIRPFIPLDEDILNHPIVAMFREMPLVKLVNFSGGLVSEDFLDHLELSLIKKRDKDEA
ncbi:beta-glucosidase family protein [Fusibacter sp. JL216-2]|uniref:beta-glucosidase family protein n=1 Tax=Fusibacter sp. JL216-2 TaxID=3071453 RepID=UPI003D3381B9